MDASEMKDLLNGYLGEMDWSGGATKEDVVNHLEGRDQDLHTMVEEYLPEGRYNDPFHLLTVIPVQAWQDSQGDEWRGAASNDPGASRSGV